MATGCLSIPKDPDIDGVERFAGKTYFTSRWPRDPVDFTGQRVAVIGTGSSGIQCIPHIARQADELLVFQRTPNFSLPAHNGPLPPHKLEQLRDEAGYRAAGRLSFGGVPIERTMTPTFTVSEDERRERYERAWQIGELLELLNVYSDVMSDTAANHELAEFFRAKIRRRSTTRRPRRRCVRAGTRSEPNVSASTPTTSRPSTGTTSGSSIYAAIPCDR